ncbi:MAG: PstA family ABC transporter permease [Phycisphaerales bacterium]
MTNLSNVGRARRGRKLRDRAFVVVCVLATLLSIAVLCTLLSSIVRDGWRHLDWEFINSFPSRRAGSAGIKSALWGSVWLVCVAAVSAIPLGVATAIAMEEFKPRRRVARMLHSFVQINIGNLAGVPSIVYGVIGLTVFARMFGLFGGTNASMYDLMAVVTLRSGEVVKGSVVNEDDEKIELVVPMKGDVVVPVGEIAKRRDVYVREHRFVLRDGRELKGQFREVTPVAITLNVTGEAGVGGEGGEEGEAVRAVTFAPADVKEYRTKNFLQFGDPAGAFYFQLPFGTSIIAGGMTLGLVILPVVIIASREALRAVPKSLREGALALGCTRWQTIRRIVLPSSVPGIMTGAILAMSRAIGEAAPLLMAGAFVFVQQTPRNLFDSFAALPLQIFNWTGRPQTEFHQIAASGILVLLGVLFVFNVVAIVIRQVFTKPLA